MIGHIIAIDSNIISVKLDIDITKQPNIIGLHIVCEDDDKKTVAEIISIDGDVLKASIVGEFSDEGQFTAGTNSKPAFSSVVRIITLDELTSLFGSQEQSVGTVYLGTSNTYSNYKINIDVNKFFSNHFAILGNSGSGKSYTVAGLFQRLIQRKDAPIGANIFMFDAYGEYTRAFENISSANPNLDYKVYTTNTKKTDIEIIKIPLWLLDVDDMALLLNVTSANQLPIIEKTLKLVPVIIGNTPDAIKRKNDIIARALQDVILSGDESTKIRDQVTAILTKFNTQELNLNSKIVEPGYTRTLKQCLYIDKTGKIQEIELVVNFINRFIMEAPVEDKIRSDIFFTLKDLEQAMEFALISEGVFKSDKVYDTANVLQVRLHTLATSEEGIYFSYPKYITREDYINELLMKNGHKVQIVDFNINYIDDRMAKTMVKIISRMVFKEVVGLEKRGSVPFHIVIEEAHRYVQKDTDTEILGYNIFDKITKEGRKYGIILGLITQRPSELSDTAISQCANFIILRMTHPKDLGYIKTMLPNVSEEIIEKVKNLKAGNCLTFGTAFKVPISIYVDPPNPPPLSDNVDMVKVWHNSNGNSVASSLSNSVPENTGVLIQTSMAQSVPEMNTTKVAPVAAPQNVNAPNLMT